MLTEPLGLDHVLAARTAIGGRLHRTPTFSSATLSERAGVPVFLKAELFQRTGSFKPRGVLTKLASLTAEERARGVIGVSAGNHAQAVAYGARAEGIDALVVTWVGASAQKVAATRGYGAEVDQRSGGPAEAFVRLAELMAATGRTLVHPFDDPYTIAGQGTVGLELLEDVPDADVVLVPVGGGGLVAGVALAVKAQRRGARVIGIEPEASDALGRALAAGGPVPLDPRSIADGLNAPFAGEHCFEVCRRLLDAAVTVSEADIAAGMRFLYERAKLACEPAAAAGVAALLAGRIELGPRETVVAIVSGGNVAAQTASAILEGR